MTSYHLATSKCRVFQNQISKTAHYFEEMCQQNAVSSLPLHKLHRFQMTLNRSLSIKPADVLFGTIGSTFRVAGGFFKRQERVCDCNCGLRSGFKWVERNKWCFLLMYPGMGRRKPWRLWHFAHLVSDRDGVSWRTRMTNWKLLLSALENETNAQSTCSGCKSVTCLDGFSCCHCSM